MSNITASDPYLPSSNIKVSYNYTDVAKNKTATQSSTLSGFSTAVASSAVDGNTDGNFFDGSVSHTNDDPNAWWEVDLGYSTSVSSIVIWNRTDCCGSRLSDYWVFVSDTPFLSTDTPATLQNRPGTWSSHQTTQPNPSVSVSIPQAQGRYVRVQLSGTNYLALAEVQVYGTNSGPGANTSKINSVYDAISGESVAYQYDSLNRLISAAGSGWTQTQAYDGFGNLTGRTGTGTAQSTTISTPTNATTNQLTGYSYDANGNLISTGYSYDVENRVSFANAGGVQYFYDAQNKRVWQATCLPGYCTPGGTWILNSATVNLFGADGKQLASYGPIPAWNNMTTNQVAITFGPVAVRSYFGGKLVGQQLGSNIYEPVIQDRLGSVGKYYPYGEERNSPQLPNDQVKFATYTRDSATGNDYADQRYYTSVLGRFMTPDLVPGQATNPQSWNRYPYSSSDPVDLNDPTGLFPPPMYETPDPFSDPSAGGGGGGGDYGCPISTYFDAGTGLCLGIPGVAPPPAASDPTPSCLDGASQRDINYVENNAEAAALVSSSDGGAISAAFILAWAAVESGFGTSNVAQKNHNFFGEKFLVSCGPTGSSCVPNTNPNARAPWKGAVPCAQLGSGANPGFACFVGSNLAGSAAAALASRNGKYLQIAQSMPGASPAQLGQAIADAGWCTNGNCPNGGYGQQIQGDYNELLPILECLFPELVP